MLVYSIGKGSSLDPSLGEFILSDENIQIPNHGPIYSVNEGNFWQWDDNPEYMPTTALKVILLGMVGNGCDIHRILVQGGVSVPGTQKKPEGKLRLLYESVPLAF